MTNAGRTPGTRRRRFRGATTTVLALLLACLSGYSVVSSWHQTRLVRSVAAAGVHTDAYQQAAYLVSWEMALIQTALRNPDGDERHKLPEVRRQAIEAMQQMSAIDTEHHQNSLTITEKHLIIGPAITEYLMELDEHDVSLAQLTLEQAIEPTYAQMMDSLVTEQAHHLADYDQLQADAQADAQRSLLAGIVVFLLGLVVLVLLRWSGRTHRRQVEAMAATDGLTGLPNRTAFAAHATRALGAETPPTVLVVNVDGFRDVNDQLGQSIGDLLLIEVGHRLAGAVRDGDLVARLGGDEFAVLLADGGADGGEIIAARLTEACQRPFVLDEITVDLEVSIGAATAQAGEDLVTVVRHADTAMHAAKQHHAGFHRFSQEQRQDTAARLTLLGDLRRALDDPGQLTLHYQPKIAVDTGELIGVEALARWTHPTRGPISPVDFIPVLEITSLMHRFTEQVLTMALAQARAWRDAGYRVPIAVNISARSLLDPAFPDRVAALLAEAGVAGEQLCVEVTEYALMSDPDTAIEALRRIRRLGVKASIDDYGTGYSSMTYLKRLPVDELKIDRSFVQDIAHDHSSQALVASTVELGHSLGLTVVAEGVEDAGAVEALRAIGCDVAQGYHFSRPVPAEMLFDRLEAQLVG